MDNLFDFVADVARAQAAALKPRTILGEAAEVIDEAGKHLLAQQTRIRDLEDCLRRMIEEHDETVSNTEGHYPSQDSGCIECTLGTVPDRFNTGLCAYHKAKALLR